MQTVETLNDGLKRGYKLTIPAAEIEARIDKELRKVAPQVRMPGFRPGKVPANLVRKMHGPALSQEALQTAVQEGVQQVLAENRLRPAMQPAVKLGDDYAPGRDAEVEVQLETLPDVPAPQIDGLKLERLTVPVDEARVEEQLRQLADQQRSFDAAPEDHPAAAGDLVVMDFVGKVDGEAFEGGSGEAMSVELGSGQLIPGFEDGLTGIKAGESRSLDLQFPENYGAKHLAGKPATFDVTATEIRVRKETAVDDEFAKALGLEGIDQLRGLIHGQVEQELNGLTRTQMKRRLLDQLADAHDFPVPQGMVEAEFEQIWRQLESEAARESDPEAARAEMEGEREEYRAIAERRVRLGLLLSEIGNANGVEVSQQEMQRLIAQAAQQYRPEDRERFVEYVRQEPMAAAQLRAPLFEDKVVDFLFGRAEITEREVTREELEAAIEAELPAGVHLPAEEHVHGPDCDHDHDHAHGHDHAPAALAAEPEQAAEVAPAPKKGRTKKAAAEGGAATDAETAAEVSPKKARAKKDAGEDGEVAPKRPRAKKAAGGAAAEAADTAGEAAAAAESAADRD